MSEDKQKLKGVPVTEAEKALFIENMKEMVDPKKAAAQVGRDLGTFYRIAKKNPEFMEAWKDAEREALDSLYTELYRRAKEGIDEPVFYKGVMVGMLKKYSDNAAQFILERRREGFEKRDKTELTGKDGKPLLQTDEIELARRVAFLLTTAGRKSNDNGGSSAPAASVA